MLAASRGNKEIVEFLLDKKADSINGTNDVSNIMLDKHVHSRIPVMIADLRYCERSN